MFYIKKRFESKKYNTEWKLVSIKNDEKKALKSLQTEINRINYNRKMLRKYSDVKKYSKKKLVVALFEDNKLLKKVKV